MISSDRVCVKCSVLDLCCLYIDELTIQARAWPVWCLWRESYNFQARKIRLPIKTK